MTKNKKEALLYLFFGGMTTLVNLLIFMLFEAILGGDLYLISNLIAWIGAVIFAFIVNKLFVFNSRNSEKRVLLKEISEFVGARIFSFCFEEAGLFILVHFTALGAVSFGLFGITVSGQLIAKAILAVIVVILNYFFSKYVIFKGRNS